MGEVRDSEIFSITADLTNNIKFESFLGNQKPHAIYTNLQTYKCTCTHTLKCGKYRTPHICTCKSFDTCIPESFLHSSIHLTSNY